MSVPSTLYYFRLVVPLREPSVFRVWGNLGGSVFMSLLVESLRGMLARVVSACCETIRAGWEEVWVGREAVFLCGFLFFLPGVC